jgi:hypothetical protein
MLQNIKADLVEAAEDYLQKNPQSDRRVIDKALRSRFVRVVFKKIRNIGNNL